MASCDAERRDLAELALFYRSKVDGVIVDTNLLMLLVVGAFARDRIPAFPRLQQLTVEDYDRLSRFLAIFGGKLFTTPHILAEASNLARGRGGGDGDLASQYLAALRGLMHQLKEEHVPATSVTQERIYLQVGLTDTVIFSMAAQRLLVITNEDALYGHLEAIGRLVLNMSDIHAFPTA